MAKCEKMGMDLFALTLMIYIYFFGRHPEQLFMDLLGCSDGNSRICGNPYIVRELDDL